MEDQLPKIGEIRPAGGVARTARPGRVLDVVAFASLVALDAQQVLIAVKSGNGWSVEGFASASHSDSEPLTSLLYGASELTLGVAAPVRLECVAAEWRLSTDSVDTTASGEQAKQVAIAGRGPDGSMVLLVADGAAVGADDRLNDLLSAAAEGVVVEEEIQQERLRESLGEREDERRHWARELHDDTLQQLGALHVLLTSVNHGRVAGEQVGPDLEQVLETAVALVVGQIDSLRHLINELRPAALDELGLRPPLEALAERTERLTGMRVETQMSLPYADGRVSTRLMPEIELAVYRVVQEALANAARHSGGSQARVVVVEDADQIRVEVTDNGTGPGLVTGFGIQGMRERAVLAGGHLQVRPRNEHGASEPKGTVVRMVLPALHRPDVSNGNENST